MKEIRNIALFAHVDAGKTTVTESLLFSNGNIRTRGSVDKGTSHTDFLDIEKEKGISVRAACVSFERENTTINLIDTPGHIDFSSETERSLLAIDGAVLIMSAVEGVQSHTETLWAFLRELKIPTILFINKIDRTGADGELIVEEIRSVLSPNIIELQKTSNETNKNANIIDIFNENKIIDNNIIEIIAEQNDDLLEKYFEDQPIKFEELQNTLIKATKECKLFPVLYGVAKNEIGTKELIEAIIKYLPEPEQSNNQLSGFIYKVEHDKILGKISHVRLFSGEIKSRDTVYNRTQNIEEKVAQIKKVFTQKYIDTKEIQAGDIAVITGFVKSKAGDTIGEFDFDKKDLLKSEIPLLTVKVTAKNNADAPKLLDAFRKLSDEDPNINMQWLSDLRELHINIKGKIQIEILTEILRKRFGIEANFDEPVIIYKETPTKQAEGYVRYWMPKPCWAIMRFKIEPAEIGSGVVYKSELSFDKIKQRYQNQVERAIPKALKQGIKGWEVTDLKITLIDGEDHPMHTHPPDFTVATPMGIMDGLQNSDTTLLEPILSFRITAPEDMLGKIASDLTKMRATFGNPEFENQKVILKGLFPVATSLNYPIKLASVTGGKGKISTKFHSYQKCTLKQGKTTEYRGISPLDRAKYILHIRNAL